MRAYEKRGVFVRVGMKSVFVYMYTREALNHANIADVTCRLSHDGDSKGSLSYILAAGNALVCVCVMRIAYRKVL